MNTKATTNKRHSSTQQTSIDYCRQAFDALASLSGQGRADSVEYAMAAEIFDTEFASLSRHGLQPSDIVLQVFEPLYRQNLDMAILLIRLQALADQIRDLTLPAVTEVAS